MKNTIYNLYKKSLWGIKNPEEVIVPGLKSSENSINESKSCFKTIWQLYESVFHENKDRLIDKIPNLDDTQKQEMKDFFKKRPNLENKFDWNKPSSIKYEDFINLASQYPDPLNPDDIKEFSDKRNEGNGIVSYEVQDDEAGQRMVRMVVDSHWGKDANPWCLISRNHDKQYSSRFMDWFEMNFSDYSDYDWELWDEKTQKKILEKAAQDFIDMGHYPYTDRDLRDAYEYWERYDALPKRIAFKNGKLLAFMATEAEDYEKPIEFDEVLDDLNTSMSYMRNALPRYKIEPFYSKYNELDEKWKDKNISMEERDELIEQARKLATQWKEWVEENAFTTIVRDKDKFLIFDELNKEIVKDDDGNEMVFHKSKTGKWICGEEDIPEEWWDREDHRYPNLNFAR